MEENKNNLDELLAKVEEMTKKQEELEQTNKALVEENESAKVELARIKLASTNKPIIQVERPSCIDAEFNFNNRIGRKEEN